MLLVAPTAALGADECPYENYRNEQTVIFLDARTFDWTVPNSVVIRCVEDENTYARGPFPATCDNGSGEPFHIDYAFYPDASGDVGALFWMGGDIWYRRCD